MGKTIIIDEKLHNELKTYCKKNNKKINEYVNNLIFEHLNFKLEKKSKLPLILKDSTGEIVETIVCNEISAEYQKNLPTGITLLRTTSDNTGFIANYVQK